jgi:chitin disaccharide deacetylase
MCPVSVLIVTADDYGYAPAYDRGILEAAADGAVDAVSAFSRAERAGDAARLLAAGVEIGLHLDGLPLGMAGGERELELMRAHVAGEIERFEHLFGRAPAYIDGHRHCHAGNPQTEAVAEPARERGLPVRGVSDQHRRRLRELGVVTADHLIGRSREADPVLPAELDEGGELAHGVTEWMTHPGHADPGSGSSYDLGRQEDLRLLLALGDRDAWAARGIERRTHAEALTAAA